LASFHEILVGHRLVEGDELDPAGGKEPLIGSHQLCAILGHGFPAQPTAPKAETGGKASAL
jgi:hypothetical protein